MQQEESTALERLVGKYCRLRYGGEVQDWHEDVREDDAAEGIFQLGPQCDDGNF